MVDRRHVIHSVEFQAIDINDVTSVDTSVCNFNRDLVKSPSWWVFNFG